LVNGSKIVKCRETEVGIDSQLMAKLLDTLLPTAANEINNEATSIPTALTIQ
jgi:hypothetical protein